MLKLNSNLKNEAIAALEGNWVTAAVVTFVYMVICGGASLIPAIGSLVSLIISPLLVFGLTILFYELLRDKRALEVGRLFDGFQDFGRIFGTGILMQIYVILWSLLLIVPGIIKSYSYALTYYILKDEPELKYNAAIEKSMQMMDGYKMKLFLLDLGFIGWGLLSCLTLGLGFLLLIPYMQTAHAAFYEDLKAELRGGHNWTESASAASAE